MQREEVSNDEAVGGIEQVLGVASIETFLQEETARIMLRHPELLLAEPASAAVLAVEPVVHRHTLACGFDGIDLPDLPMVIIAHRAVLVMANSHAVKHELQGFKEPDEVFIFFKDVVRKIQFYLH
jgi:hypothetical protein